MSLNCPGGPHSAVDLSSFRCDPELSRLLGAKGVGSTLKARLAQAGDVEGFMAELTDVLEKVRRGRGGGGRVLPICLGGHGQYHTAGQRSSGLILRISEIERDNRQHEMGGLGPRPSNHHKS